MYQPVATKAKYTPWRSSRSSGIPPRSVVPKWDRLLDRLGLTEAEALAAIVDRRDAAQPIRRFVREEFHEHFVPEDVLLAMNLERNVAEDDS